MEQQEMVMHVVHTYPDAQVESVKLERNTKGFNIEVKAVTVERALALYDQAKRDTDARLKQEG
jgi:hypothetical protein